MLGVGQEAQDVQVAVHELAQLRAQPLFVTASKGWLGAHYSGAPILVHVRNLLGWLGTRLAQNNFRYLKIVEITLSLPDPHPLSPPGASASSPPRPSRTGSGPPCAGPRAPWLRTNGVDTISWGRCKSKQILTDWETRYAQTLLGKQTGEPQKVPVKKRKKKLQ